MTSNLTEKWIPQNTAILIVHGIGHQEPLETLDKFVRGVIKTLRKNHPRLTLSHKLAKKPRASGGFWYDNYIRIKHSPTSFYLDIYEYYWANLTEDKTNLREINQWARKVSNGAKKFYKENSELGQKYGDQSFFFKNGRFRSVRYRAILWLLTWIIPLYRYLLSFFISSLAGFCPQLANDLQERISRSFVNLVGDIIIYNTASVKSKNYETRKDIMDGAVKALQYLIEPVELQDSSEFNWNYNRVIVSGHSLGSQIAFDAINRLTHIITQGDVPGFDNKGFLVDKDHEKSPIILEDDICIKNVSDLLCGLQTFGSPLDKIAFFLRERVEEKEHLRLQLLENFHCFKQKNLSGKKIKAEYKLESPFKPLFEDIRWYNYFDKCDFISGSLDYYENVKNIDVTRTGGRKGRAGQKLRFLFTHGDYWLNKDMYKQLVNEFICSQKPPKHTN